MLLRVLVCGGDGWHVFRCSSKGRGGASLAAVPHCNLSLHNYQGEQRPVMRTQPAALLHRLRPGQPRSCRKQPARRPPDCLQPATARTSSCPPGAWARAGSCRSEDCCAPVTGTSPSWGAPPALLAGGWQAMSAALHAWPCGTRAVQTVAEACGSLPAGAPALRLSSSGLSPWRLVDAAGGVCNVPVD